MQTCVENRLLTSSSQRLLLKRRKSHVSNVCLRTLAPECLSRESSCPGDGVSAREVVAMNGILALFKPKGLTSAELLNQFKTFLVKGKQTHDRFDRLVNISSRNSLHESEKAKTSKSRPWRNIGQRRRRRSWYRKACSNSSILIFS